MTSESTESKKQAGRLWLYVLINLAAMPGLGTILAGRRVGYVQAILMIAGFCLVTGYMIWFFVCAARYVAGVYWTEEEFKAAYRVYAWAWQYGLLLTAVAWLWALWSSLLLWKNHQRAS